MRNENYIYPDRLFGPIAGVFDSLGIGEVVDSRLRKSRHHKHSMIIVIMVLGRKCEKYYGMAA
jgi:hypothetical protein